MKKSTLFGIPNNFEELLPELKAKTIKWETVCYSGTEINNSARITYYAAFANKIHGNIILSPGLATNTDIDPLMKMLIFWALTHRHNVITFNTFLGDFHESPSFELAQRNTYSEFVSLIESCINFTMKHTLNQQNILIGHSVGATGVIDALNNIAKQNKKTNIDSVMLFAPFASNQWETFKGIIYKRYESTWFAKSSHILPITNVFDCLANGHTRYVSILPKFYNELCEYPFQPDLMNKWNTYITIIAGERDRKSPPAEIREKFEELEKQSNKNLFDFILLPNEKHSFLRIYKNNQSVIGLIKSQRKKLR